MYHLSYPIIIDLFKRKCLDFRNIRFVVLDEADEIVAIEEVETETTLTPEEGKQWRDYANLGYPLHLFVPIEKRDRALEILKTTPNIPTNIGLRSYVIVEGKVVIL